MTIKDKNGNYIVETSRAFAKIKHNGQTRKRTGLSYYIHLLNVAELVRANNGTDVQIAIAYLHDVIEDTDTTYSELLDLFPIEVAEGVLSLSNDRDEEMQVGKVAYLVHKVSSLSDDLLMVKLCDIFDNTVDIAESDDAEWKQKFYDKYMAVINGLSNVSGKKSELLFELKSAMGKLEQSIYRKPYITMERFFEYNKNKESFQRLSLEEKIANYNERTKNIHFVRLSDSFFKRKRFKSSEEELEFFIDYRNKRASGISYSK